MGKDTKMIGSFAKVFFLDHLRFLGNCPPTPSLSQHSERGVSVNVGLGEG